MPNETEFLVPDMIWLFHPWTNIVTSWNAYAVFGFIIYACIQKGVYSKRIADVLPILMFAFLSDLAKNRMMFYFILNPHEKHAGPDPYWSYPTTVAACTLGVWIFYLHFMITYVEAIVTARRFIVHILREPVPISYIFTGLGIVFALQALVMFEAFLHGEPTELRWKLDIVCSKAYVAEGLSNISRSLTLATMVIAPVFSVLLMFKRSASAEKVRIPHEYENIFVSFIIGGFTIQDFRFPLLVILAIGIVGDIREAVFSTISGGISNLFGKREKAPLTFTNNAYLELDLE